MEAYLIFSIYIGGFSTGNYSHAKGAEIYYSEQKCIERIEKITKVLKNDWQVYYKHSCVGSRNDCIKLKNATKLRRKTIY